MPDTPLPRARVKETLLDAILVHVPFDGWSEKSFTAAIADTGLQPVVARGVCPRGAVDLALAQHERGDEQMALRLKSADLDQMRFRDKVTTAVRFRIEAIPDRETARRATTLFALPQWSADGARAIWGTADRIWEAVGDTSEDINWYTKRATLAGVYASTVLYWLGDDSPESRRTWRFLDRRIDDVMQIERVKGQINANPVLRRAFAGPAWALSFVRAPTRVPRVDLPGSWTQSG